MDSTSLPLVRQVVSVGPDNRVFDGLLTGGPLVILLVAVFGRNVYTLGLAVGYLSLFVVGVAFAALRRRDGRGGPSNTSD